MKLSTTIGLLIVTAGVIAYILLVERHEPTSDEAASTAHLLSPADPLDINEIKIENGTGVVRLRWSTAERERNRRRGGDPEDDDTGDAAGDEAGEGPKPRLREQPGLWRVTQPFKDRANQEFAEALITTVTELEIIQRIGGAHLVQGEDPFDASAREITLKRDKDTNLVHVVVGRTGAFQNSVYARNLNSDPDVVYVAKAPDITVLSLPPAEVRDPKLLPYGASAISRIRVQGAQGEIELARLGDGDRAQWWLTKPLNARADNAAVGDLIAALMASRVTAYSPAGSGAASQPNPNTNTTGANENPAPAPPPALSFDDPAYTVSTWAAPDDDPETLRFLAPPGAAGGTAPPADATPNPALVKIAGRSPVFSVDPAILTALDLMPNDLRSDTLAGLDPATVNSITVKTPSYPDGYILYRRGAGWQLYHNSRSTLANASRAEGLIRSLNSTTVLEFTDDAASDLAPYGLDDPFRTVTFGRSPATIAEDRSVSLPPPAAGEAATLRLGQGDRGRIYANFEGTPFVYTVDPSLIAEIPEEPIEWRSLLVASFSSAFDLRTITLTEGGLPPLILARDPETLAWSAARPGVDLTAMIDPAKVNALADRFATFYADDWLTGRGEPLAVLESNPSLTVKIGLVRAPEPGAEPAEETVTLRFAPTTPGQRPGFYYGNREGMPEVFLLTGEHYRELTESLLRERPAPVLPPQQQGGAR